MEAAGGAYGAMRDGAQGSVSPGGDSLGGVGMHGQPQTRKPVVKKKKRGVDGLWVVMASLRCGFGFVAAIVSGVTLACILLLSCYYASNGSAVDLWRNKYVATFYGCTFFLGGIGFGMFGFLLKHKSGQVSTTMTYSCTILAEYNRRAWHLQLLTHILWVTSILRGLQYVLLADLPGYRGKFVAYPGTYDMVYCMVLEVIPAVIFLWVLPQDFIDEIPRPTLGGSIRITGGIRASPELRGGSPQRDGSGDDLNTQPLSGYMERLGGGGFYEPLVRGQSEVGGDVAEGPAVPARMSRMSGMTSPAPWEIGKWHMSPALSSLNSGAASFKTANSIGSDEALNLNPS